MEERLEEHLWSRQRDILQEYPKHRKILIKSCHNVGKSHLVARITGHWLDTHEPGTAFVVTSAPSGAQVKAILWRYIGRVHAKGKLNGRVNQTEWHMFHPSGKEELVAFGRKPKDFDPDAFQGIHARFVLVIFDESNGIRGPLHAAADSLTSNDGSKRIMIGNPDDPSGEFYEASKPGSGWHVESISAFESPNFTGEECPTEIKAELIGHSYVEDMRKIWAANWYWVGKDGKETTAELGVRCVCPEGQDPQDTNPYWQSKILGIFPEISEENGLIPISWIKAAQERSLPAKGDSVLGVDVGGGGDASTIAHKHGQRVRIKHEDHNPDTMHTCGVVLHWLKLAQATKANVDVIGIGRGVVDRGAEQGKPFHGIDVGSSPWELLEEIDPSLAGEGFQNLRAQLYWNLRILFETGQIDISAQDEKLAAELASIRYQRLSNGTIQIEPKKAAKARGISSPNRAEAAMLACAPEHKENSPALTWGR